jgi:hypothetical protein
MQLISFWHYITGYPIVLHTDHAAIKYLMNKPITNGRVTRWLLLLQEYDITILNKPGKDNVVVDFLSRLTSNENEPPVEDYFPDEHLFVVSTNSPWFIDITNYLDVGRLPHHLSPKEKQKIIKQSWIFSWIDDCLFYTGLYLIIRRCVREDKIYEILKDFHDGPCGGHFVDKRTGYKVLHQGYYWPTIFKDAKEYVKRCDSFHAWED